MVELLEMPITVYTSRNRILYNLNHYGISKPKSTSELAAMVGLSHAITGRNIQELYRYRLVDRERYITVRGQERYKYMITKAGIADIIKTSNLKYPDSANRYSVMYALKHYGGQTSGGLLKILFSESTTTHVSRGSIGKILDKLSTLGVISIRNNNEMKREFFMTQKQSEDFVKLSSEGGFKAARKSLEVTNEVSVVKTCKGGWGVDNGAMDFFNLTQNRGAKQGSA